MHLAVLAILAILPLAATAAQQKPGDPLKNLPTNIESLTHFGERADISPDNKRVAFMVKSFGDAMVIDLKTRIITCLTCNVPGAAFLRVMHLVTGDYILIGPEHFESVKTSRSRDNELWFLSKEHGSKPVRLGQKLLEGAAISKKDLKIGFSQSTAQAPDGAPATSRLMVADLNLSRGAPKLINKKTVYETMGGSCDIEAQDFYDNDAKMVFTCYQFELQQGTCYEHQPGIWASLYASVMGIDLASGKVTNFSQAPSAYNEAEGIFPDGRFTAVEVDSERKNVGDKCGYSNNIDIWKLRLDGTGKNLVRLTHFNDYEGGKASNPVISTDGSFMAFQVGRRADAPGVGYGIQIYWFDR